MKAVRVHESGGPEKLVYDEVEIPSPGAGEVAIRVEAVGVNYIDTYHRSGLYPLDLPFTIGVEAAGVVESVGPGVSAFSPGDRVAVADGDGTYAEYCLTPADRLIAIPDSLDFRSGAAAMLQGMTAHYLSHSTFPLRSEHTALVHAGAGGVGLLLIQMCKRLGARVFATVSTDEKAELARGAGADEVILYARLDFKSEVDRLTNGRGVDVVYDSVARDTFEMSLDSLALRGYLVLYGQSSGPVPPIDPRELNTKGSLFLTRPKLGDYTASRKELEWRASDVLNWVSDGSLTLRMEHEFSLADAADAHRVLEGRKTTGKVLLIP